MDSMVHCKEVPPQTRVGRLICSAVYVKEGSGKTLHERVNSHLFCRFWSVLFGFKSGVGVQDSRVNAHWVQKWPDIQPVFTKVSTEKDELPIYDYDRWQGHVYFFTTHPEMIRRWRIGMR